MSAPSFDFEGAFDDDYLYFYAAQLDASTDSDVELIWQLLELSPGMEVLDLACGHGRIANRLAERGCRVTGLDASALFVQLAREDAEARGVTVDYVLGDMRNLEWIERFDRIINWFTAFGYFDDGDNQRVLARAAAALRPGGRLAIETMHLLELMRRFTPVGVVERDGDFMIDRRRLEPLGGRVVTDRIIIRDGRSRHVPFYVRLFTFTELRDWLVRAGFTHVSGHGTDAQPLTAASPRMIVVAER